MNDLSAAAPGMVKQAIQVIKVTRTLEPTNPVSGFIDALLTRVFSCLQSINTLQKQAEGLCEILGMKPSHATAEIHREVFGLSGQSDAPLPPANDATGNRQPIKRAVEEAAATDCYVPLSKKPVGAAKPE